MSEVVEKTTENVPAKSEDKLEIEKEEQEGKENDDTKEEKKEEKSDEKEVEKSEDQEDPKDTGQENLTKSGPMDEEKKCEDEKEQQSKSQTEDVSEKMNEDNSNVKDPEKGDERKFSLPKVKIKTPKVLKEIRSRSKSREKRKKNEETDDTKEEKDSSDPISNEKKANEEEKLETKNEKEKDEVDSEKKDIVKEAKTKVKDALDNINLPKVPKISKPGFMKKKDKEKMKESTDDDKDNEESKEPAKEEDNDDKASTDENLESDGNVKEKVDEKQNTATDQTTEEKAEKEQAGEETEKEETKKDTKTTLMDSLKNLKGPKMQNPFSKNKKDEKGSDLKEESEKLLENKGDEDLSEKKESEKSDNCFMMHLRHVAKSVPSRLKRDTKPEKPDLETGEGDLLLEKKESDKNLKEEMVEIKLNDDENNETENEKKDDSETKSIISEKKDPEKGDMEATSLKEDKVTHKWTNISLQKRLGLLGCIIGLILLLVIIILAACLVGTSDSSPFKQGKIVETLISCGKVQGIQEGESQFKFRSIPYSVPVDRFEHSRLPSTLDECGDEVLEHSNETRSCLRLTVSGEIEGEEDCLLLDIDTPSLEYTAKLPVVVYLPGGSEIRPSSLLAKEQNTVFVTINIRQGILGFLSHPLLGEKQNPPVSGNYGLNDFMTALKWIQLNVDHFGGNSEDITVLGHKEGASIATASTALDTSSNLMKRLWATSGSGKIKSLTLDEAKEQWNSIVEQNCNGKKRQCLLDIGADELIKAFNKLKDSSSIDNLPSKGKETQLIMLVEDTHIMRKSLEDTWKEKKITIPIVLGSTAQAEANPDNFKFSTWNDTDETANIVESSLASFDLELPSKALEAYNSSSNWQDYISMVTDVRTLCPLLEFSKALKKTSSDISFYVADISHKDGNLGEIADSEADISAIFSLGVESKYPKEIQNSFFNFVKGFKTNFGSDVTIFQESGKSQITDWKKCQIWRNNSVNILDEYARRY